MTTPSLKPRLALALAALVLLGLLGLSLYSLDPKNRPASRTTTRVTDSSGRLLEVTSPIDPSEVDLELQGGLALVHTGALAAWRAIPFAERLAVTEEGAVFNSASGQETRFTKRQDGSYATASSGVALADQNGTLVLSEASGSKHFFTSHLPFPIKLELGTGEQIYLSYKPDGSLIRIQSGQGKGGYSLTWKADGKVEKLLDEASGVLWEWHYSEGAVRISVARPVAK